MRILSGIQPSGQLHLGNYFGSILPNIDWHQKADAAFFMIADLHALTTIQDKKKLDESVRNLELDLLSCGFSEKTTIFRQSLVPEHAELMWILSTVTPMGLLERAVSYKEKVQKGIAASSGLFMYPVLQAADILLYNIDKVPVGKDQQQHLEMSRDIAIKFNNAFGDTLTVPEGVVREEVAIVPGTDGQKMSKSYGNTIPMFGTEKEIKKAIMGIVTDSKDVQEKKDPETNTIFKLHSLFLSKDESKKVADRYAAGGLGYGEAKTMLFDAFMQHVAPLHKKREELAKNPKKVEELIQAGSEKARTTAMATIERVRSATGL